MNRKGTGERMGTVVKRRGPVVRGLSTLFIFVLTFIVSMVVVYIISFVIVFEVLGYDLFDRDPNPPPNWLHTILVPAQVGICLALASFSGWRFWGRGQRRERRDGPLLRGLLALVVFVWTFIISMVVVYIIALYIVFGLLGYEWLHTILVPAQVGICLVLASFLGWKTWNHRR